MANVAKTFVNSNLRHNEYYNLQNTFDELYAKAQDKESFKDLMSIILSRENIELAYATKAAKLREQMACRLETSKTFR